jgi:hypothetical protein
MKTPREILFQHHAAADTKLDALRRKVVTQLQTDSIAPYAKKPRAKRTTIPHAFLSVVSQWLSNPMLRQRTALAGLATAWLVIGALNLATKASQSPTVAQGKPQPLTPETLQVLQQQRRLYAELASPVQPARIHPSAPALPGPRSQRREESFTV